MSVFRAALTAAVSEAERRPTIELEALHAVPGIVGLSAEFVLSGRLEREASAARRKPSFAIGSGLVAKHAIFASALRAAVLEAAKLDAPVVEDLARYGGIVAEAARRTTKAADDSSFTPIRRRWYRS